ncbi:extracellular solute-binding protein [Echinicola sediminis]
MSDLITIKGIAWDHPRGYHPLIATSKSFSKLHPNISIEWNIRSLKEFGDMPIEELIDTYDIITIDHPYMGQAHSNGLLVPLEKQLPHSVLDLLREQSVGPSFDSYQYEGHLYALPVDAAALVAASRKDLISLLNQTLPSKRKELIHFIQNIPSGYYTAWPLCPTDLWCNFLTLCAQDGGSNFISEGKINPAIGAAVLDELKFCLKFLHPDSIKSNPIEVLNQMSSENEIIYAPYLFGYTNYSRNGFAEHLVHFSDSPINPSNDISTILGGVGLAISAKSMFVEFAVEYLQYVASASVQKGIYTYNDGQPANIEAWDSPEANSLCADFFSSTKRTMEKAYVRPQHPRWNEFQEKGADLLHQGISKGSSSDSMMQNLNQLYQSIRKP